MMRVVDFRHPERGIAFRLCKQMLPLKKISNYITRKVADKLKSLFTESREDFEKMERYQNRFRVRNAI
jgi:hypothetical protein